MHRDPDSEAPGTTAPREPILAQEPEPAGPARWRVWLMASRPATLPAAAGPVIVGAALAAAAGPVRPWVLAITMVTALLLQVASNLANDVFDFERGADTDERMGPLRVTQAGLATPGQVRLALVAVLLAAVAGGAVLVTVGGWPILVIGLTAIVAAIAYSGGPWPFGYHALGEVFVFIYFGVAAVTGTAYLQTGDWSVTALVLSLAPASTVTAILVVNNLRDLASDRATGKTTLAVILGATGTRIEYGVLMAAPFLVVAVLTAIGTLPPWLLITWLGLPPTARLLSTVASGLEGTALNRALAQTARVHLLLCLLMAIGLVLPRLLT
jgi:1,4-dihydroxy-2-naphthoate octaprenyltransferase